MQKKKKSASDFPQQDTRISAGGHWEFRSGTAENHLRKCRHSVAEVEQKKSGSGRKTKNVQIFTFVAAQSESFSEN